MNLTPQQLRMSALCDCQKPLKCYRYWRKLTNITCKNGFDIKVKEFPVTVIMLIFYIIKRERTWPSVGVAGGDFPAEAALKSAALLPISAPLRRQHFGDVPLLLLCLNLCVELFAGLLVCGCMHTESD